MKSKILILIFFIIWSLFIFSNTYAENSIFNNTTTNIPYCESNDCWIRQWIESIKNIDWIENEASASEYIQRITKYILWFLALIATLFIIYSWFILLTSAWDEEKAKGSKRIIIYSLIRIVIIFLAWPIVDFVLNILR